MEQRYDLTLGCELHLQQGDITKSNVDAIVNAANERMLGGGGVDGAIHRGAGRRLEEACRAIPEVKPGVRCPTGEARITPAFHLPCQHVIHTVGPIFVDTATSQPLLESAYQSSLRLANENDVKSLAFPAISCGVFGYPHQEAAIIAFEQCRLHTGRIARIAFVLFDQNSFDVWCETIAEHVKQTGIR